MDRGLWTSAAVGFLAPVVMFSPLNSARAGFLDWLFGARRPAAVGHAPVQGMHPSVTIRRQANAKRSSVRVARPVYKPIDPKEQLARTIDPTTRPDWYLIDPTLKKGDVLFLRNGVVVFRGDKVGDARSYVPVRQARNLSRKERRMFEGMASRGNSPASVPVADRLDGVKGVRTATGSASFDLKIRAN